MNSTFLTGCFVFLAAAGRAAEPDNYNPSMPAIESIQVQQDAKDPSTGELVDRMNAYRMQVELANSIEALQNRYNDRVRWELHFGAGGAIAPSTDGPVQGVGVYDNAGAYSLLSLGLKANLGNLKLPRPHRILGEVTRLRTLLGVHKYESTEKLLAECDRIEAGTKNYMDEFWFKRWALGVSFPFLYRSVNGYSERRYDYSVPGQSSTQSETIYSSDRPVFDWANTSVFLGYDLGDFVTLQAGYSVRNHVSLTVSLDTSTPVTLMATEFYHMLRGLAGTTQGTYYPRYY